MSKQLNNVASTGQEFYVYRTMHENDIVNWIVSLSTVNLETISKAGRMRVKYTPPEFHSMYRDNDDYVHAEGIIWFNTIEFRLDIKRNRVALDRAEGKVTFENFLNCVRTLPVIGVDELLQKLNRHTIY